MSQIFKNQNDLSTRTGRQRWDPVAGCVVGSGNSRVETEALRTCQVTTARPTFISFTWTKFHRGQTNRLGSGAANRIIRHFVPKGEKGHQNSQPSLCSLPVGRVRLPAIRTGMGRRGCQLKIGGGRERMPFLQCPGDAVARLACYLRRQVLG